MFCIKCGKKKNVSTQASPVITLTPEQMRNNIMNGQIEQARAEMQASWREPAKTPSLPKQTSLRKKFPVKILVIVVIIVVLTVVWFCLR